MHKRSFGIVLAALAPLWAGCASTMPPKELLDARDAYTQAANGAAAQNTPAELEVARQALSRAEQAYASAPDADATRDLAYIAQVRALIAESRGRLAGYDKVRVAADEQFKVTAANKIDSKNAALATEAARTRATGMALVAEQQRRADVEKRLRDTMDRLAALAAVKEEPRGTVITLSGSVLFASDRSELLPTAAERLNDVADVLMDQPERSVTILGFTDSRGAVEYNQGLSERRAQAVRDYLTSRGVAADRLSAVGKGPADPVADNGTAEGRANNRRVEIVLARPAKDSSDVYSP